MLIGKVVFEAGVQIPARALNELFEGVELVWPEFPTSIPEGAIVTLHNSVQTKGQTYTSFESES